MSAHDEVCVLCGSPAQIAALYFPVEKVKYHLCRDCNDGPDKSLEIERKLGDPQVFATERRELEERVAAGRAVNTQRLAEIQELHERIAKLMRMGEPGRCRDCNTAVTWMRNHATGRALPYDSNGKPHFSSCPKKTEIVAFTVLHEA